jgi:hypothetical protein
MKANDRVRRGVLLVLASVAILAANAWVLLHRMEGWNFRTAAYPTVYYPLEQPVVRGFSEAPGGLLRLELSNGERPEVQLRRGLQRYSVPVGGGRTFDFEASFTGSSQTKLFSSSFSVGSFTQYPLAELAPVAEEFDAEEIRAARQILEGAGTRTEGSTESRTVSLWQTLDAQLRDHMGEPPDDLRELPILERYRRALAGDVAIHCGHSAEIFGLFAAAAGIPTRVVDVNRVVDGIKLTSHTFNEVYLAELGRWAYVDLNLGTVFVRDGAAGLPLNGVELAQRHQSGAVDNLRATRMQQGRLRDLPYREEGRLTQLFLNPNVTFVYHRHYSKRHSIGAWLHRYLVRPELAYSLHGGNWRFFAKLGLAAAGLALVPLWVWFLARAFAKPSTLDPTSG